MSKLRMCLIILSLGVFAIGAGLLIVFYQIYRDHTIVRSDCFVKDVEPIDGLCTVASNCVCNCVGWSSCVGLELRNETGYCCGGRCDHDKISLCNAVMSDCYEVRLFVIIDELSLFWRIKCDDENCFNIASAVPINQTISCWHRRKDLELHLQKPDPDKDYYLSLGIGIPCAICFWIGGFIIFGSQTCFYEKWRRYSSCADLERSERAEGEQRNVQPERVQPEGEKHEECIVGNGNDDIELESGLFEGRR